MSRAKTGDVVEIEGKVILAKAPKEGEFGWSQWVIIKADNLKQGCWIYMDDEDEKVIKGAYIKVKGKVSSEFQYKGSPSRSVNGNVIEEIKKDENVSQEQPIKTTQETVEKTVEKPTQGTVSKISDAEQEERAMWEAKDLRNVKECISHNATALVIAKVIKLEDRFEYMREEVNFFYEGNVKIEMIKPKMNIVDESMKEFGGTATEVVEKDKQLKIAQARELVKNPHLAEPVNDKMATVKQKKQIYGYINEEGKKMGGIIDSQYLTKEERDGIGEPENLTKSRAMAMWERWYGKEGEMGERDKRELEAKEKEQKESPFVTKRNPIEKRDPKDDASLAKDVLIEKIQDLRKKSHLQDDEKFSEALDGCNTNFALWTEKELTKLKEKLEMWKPNWVTGK